MDISSDLFNRDSEEDFKERLLNASDSASGVIHVRSSEIVRTVLAIRKAAITEGNKLKEWDIEKGTVEHSADSIYLMNKKGDGNFNLGQALANMFAEITDSAETVDREETITFYIFSDPSAWLDMPVVQHHIRQAGYFLPSTQARLILVTPDKPLPESIADSVMSIHMDPPGFSELKTYANEIIESVGKDEIVEYGEEALQTLCYAGAGMSKENFEAHLSLSIVTGDTNEDGKLEMSNISEGVNIGKTEIVKRSELLELYPREDMSNVGGMHVLKEWVAKRKICYSDEAREFGITAPKGIVCVGIPGSGKSLVAKAVASELGVPLIRLDFGKVFNSLVGSSEERMRTALLMIEFMAPVVLFVDEIDKGLGGIGQGGGDSGTSSRVLGTFLTWLNDCTAPVFTMVTANNIDGLPPEMMRKGRFDEIFATGLPSAEDRLEVLNIHLRKRGWEPSKFSRKGLNSVVSASAGYVPAEIEAAVKEGLIDAYHEEEDLDMGHIVNALKRMIPLSQSYNEKVLEMVLWAKKNAVSASKAFEDVEDIADNVTSISSENRRRTKVTKAKD